jgi:hypothetical protein
MSCSIVAGWAGRRSDKNFHLKDEAMTTRNWKHETAGRFAGIRRIALLGVALTAGSALAQANVSIDLSKAVNILTDATIGAPAVMFNADGFNPAGLPYLHAAGVTSERYPGNHGAADLYHWSTKTGTAYKGATAVYFAPESSFTNFAQVAEKLGSAVIVVNYGSNLDGSGGGEPAEAAAWVAYANGDPADSRVIGKDATGHDWHTVGYWATMRAAVPLGIDDGFNFLRINHAKPFGFKLWQVGDQIYDNGYLGEKFTGNPDLHGPAPASAKDLAKLKKSPKLSPEAFGDNLKLFAAAMKTVDPTIQIGAGFTTPHEAQQGRPQAGGNEYAAAGMGDTMGSDWNRAVLKSACGSIDFVSMDWATGNPLPPDYKTLDDANLFPDTRYQISGLITAMLGQYKDMCSAGHVPRIALSSAQIQSWLKVDHPSARSLWLADTYAILVESGFLNIDLPEAFGDSMISSDHKKFGDNFYGLQMLHIVVHSPGDALVEATSSSPTLNVHATRRRDGNIGIMLVNTDPKSQATVKISLKNGGVGTTGKRFDYGVAQNAQGAAIAASPLTVSGNEFTVNVPAFTVTDLLLPFAK